MGSRYYNAGTKEALVHLCQGTCYAPSCDEPVIKKRGGYPIFNLEIAHIHAKAENGPRYDPDIDEDHFSNLILLCKPDHKLVDKTAPERYPAETLFAWKRTREGFDQQHLADLDYFDEAAMDDFVRDLTIRFEKIESILRRMEAYDKESVEILRILLRRTDFRDEATRAAINHDTANLLLEASGKFASFETGPIEAVATRLENLLNRSTNMM